MSKSTKNFIIVVLIVVLLFAFFPSLKNTISNLEETTVETESIEESSITDEESSEEESSEEISEEETVARATYELDYLMNPDGISYAITGFADVSGAEYGIELVIPSEHDGLPVTVIETDAFRENADIVSVSIPETIDSIGHDAFRDCPNMSYIYFNAANMRDLTASPFMFSGNRIVVLIGNKVTRIPNYLFGPNYPSSEYAPRISTVTFEEGSICTEIGTYAFYYHSIGSFVAPSTLLKVGAFGLMGTSGAIYDFTACESVVTFGENDSLSMYGSFTFYVSEEHYFEYKDLPIFASYQNMIVKK